MLDTFAVGGETGGAVEAVNSAVEVTVGAAQVRGHQVGVIEIGQGRAGMGGAGGQDGLREGVEFGEVGGAGGAAG